MSLVRSAALFSNREVYSRKDGNDSSGVSTSIFNTDNHGIIYSSESYSSDSYDPKYFLDSPSDDLVHTSGSDASENPFHQPRASSYQLMAGNGSLTSSLELEKALLDDNATNDDDSDNHEHSMEIDGEWSDTTRYPLLYDSPKESSSSDSILSSTSSTKEISLTTLTPKSLLFECAAAIHNGNFEEASHMINVLRQRVSIQGEPSERIAAYMVEALAARWLHLEKVFTKH
ncbi:UNVERIFIED_CONTAM: Scarecrow-like protein 1 [Sesamum radiatum]|uniref:Scarecrow-like protein 1 n=1 Tax=Sesamum radiatum TaxID=300843 RepID=A0AAW2M4R5_SESRA